MAILETKVLAGLGGNNPKYFEEKGYYIPRFKNKRGELRTPNGTKILVRVEDLPEKSGTVVTKICDICGNKVPQAYSNILKGRRNQKDGLDKCDKCSSAEIGIKKGIAEESKCIANVNPEFAKLFLNKEDTYRYTCGSNKKADFKCPQCGNELKNKVIHDMYKRGLSCPKCSDGISYPEKFMMSILEQLNIEYEFQKIFQWSHKKKYDFYIPSLNMIIETHGGQHYKETARGRSLKQEQENDLIKRNYANVNKISRYIIIDCRNSELDFVKNSVLNSELSEIFELSKVDWLECHKNSFSSLVKKACDLWNSGIKDTLEISNILDLARTTIIEYLKKGAKIGWCDYDPKEVMKNVYANKTTSHNAKAVIQLDMNGNYINEFQSANDAGKILNINGRNIRAVCNGERKSAGGFRWILKDK